MAHVQLAGRIGEHRQAVILLLAGGLNRLKSVGLLPVPLRVRFDFRGMISFLHKSGFPAIKTGDYTVNE